MRLKWLRQLFRTDQQKVAAFCENRSTESDTQFVSDCLFSEDPEGRRAATAVRHAVARLGKVDREYVKADDRYPDELGTLPMWDSLDWVAFFMELEHELGITITDKEATSFFEPRSARSLSVREMAARVRAILINKRGTQGNAT